MATQTATQQYKHPAKSATAVRRKLKPAANVSTHRVRHVSKANDHRRQHVDMASMEKILDQIGKIVYEYEHGLFDSSKNIGDMVVKYVKKHPVTSTTSSAGLLLGIVGFMLLNRFNFLENWFDKQGRLSRTANTFNKRSVKLSRNVIRGTKFYANEAFETIFTNFIKKNPIKIAGGTLSIGALLAYYYMNKNYK